MQYISVENQKAMDQAYRKAALLVAAFGISVLIYMIVARLIEPQSFVPGSESWMHPAYSAVITLGLMVVVVRRILLTKTMLDKAARGGTSLVLKHLFLITLICSVLAELVAIAGLVLYFMTSDYQYSWRLGIVALFLLVYTFPRRGEWERAVVYGVQVENQRAASV